MKTKFKEGDRVKVRYIDSKDIVFNMGFLNKKGTIVKHKLFEVDNIPYIEFDDGTVKFFHQSQLVKLKKKVK